MTVQKRDSPVNSACAYLGELKRTLSNYYGLDYRSLALLRLGTAIAILLSLAVRVPDLIALFSDDGCVPRSCVLQLASPPGYFSIYYLAGSWTSVALLFALQAALAVMLLVGYQTRLASLLSWIFMVSLLNRNPIIVGGLDVVLRMMLMWGIFLPWGRYFSVDAAKNRIEPPASSTVFSAGTLAYIVQIQLIYFCTFVHKTSSAEWTNGSGILYALNVDFITTPFGIYLTKFPELLKVLTFGTLMLEAALPILLIMPFKRGMLKVAALAGMILLQIGFAVSFKLGLFPLINIISLCAFIPASIWECKGYSWAKAKIGASIKPLFNQLANVLPYALQLPAKSDHDAAASNDTGIARPLLDLKLLSQRALDGTTICLLAIVCLFNLSTLPTLKIRLPDLLIPVVNVFRLDQNWYMFAYFHPQLNGWYVMPGRLANGEVVDIFRNGMKVSWQRPACIAQDYKSERWCRYLVELFNRKYLDWRPYYVTYLAKEWNNTHAAQAQLKELQIYYIYEGALPEINPQDRANPIKLLVWQQDFKTNTHPHSAHQK